jgi:hypothetical protein
MQKYTPKELRAAYTEIAQVGILLNFLCKTEETIIARISIYCSPK